MIVRIISQSGWFGSLFVFNFRWILFVLSSRVSSILYTIEFGINRFVVELSGRVSSMVIIAIRTECILVS